MSTAQLRPEPAKGTSVVRVPRAWYIACRSRALKKQPIKRVLLGQPIALFRAQDGSVGALLDRCPHRNVPLSLGKVRGSTLECAYHGWRFETDGRCTKVPALCANGSLGGLGADAFPCVERDGFIWVWADLASEPDCEPFRFPLIGEPGYTTVTEHVVAKASVHATAENALDVPHTAFLHAGLFRSDETDRNRIEVVVRRWPDKVEAEYIGEPRPEGVVGKLLAPQGGTVEHFDRFLLPSIVQVEYRLGQTHLLVCAALTPEADYLTHLWAVISFRLPIPGAPIIPLLKPLAMRIFGQDAEVLAKQTANIEHFGGERYVSTEVDVLGPHILRLLRQAERARPEDGQEKKASKKPAEKRFYMDV